MRKLSFYILGIILLFVIIFAATPYFVGNSLKHAQLNKLLSEQKSIKVTDYKQHWFSSEADVLLSPSALTNLDIPSPLALNLHLHIEHGPLVSYTLNGEKHRKLAKAVIFVTAAPDVMKGQVIILLDWDGTTSTKYYAIDSLNKKVKNDSISIKNFSGVIHNRKHDGKHIRELKLDVAQLFMSYESAPAVINQYALSHHQTHSNRVKESGLWLGNITKTVGDLIVLRNNNPTLAFKGMQSSSSSTLANGLVHYKMHMQAAKTSFAKQPLGALVADIEIDKVNAEALKHLLDSTKNINKFHPNFAQLFKLISPAIHLFEKGLTIQIPTFQLSLPNVAPLQLKAQIQFLTTKNGLNIFNLTKHIQANGSLSLPQELLLQQLTEFYQDMISTHHKDTGLSAEGRAKQALATWINNRMLTKNSDGTLSLTFKTEDGTLLINGVHPNFSTQQARGPVAKKPL